MNNHIFNFEKPNATNAFNSNATNIPNRGDLEIDEDL